MNPSPLMFYIKNVHNSTGKTPDFARPIFSSWHCNKNIRSLNRTIISTITLIRKPETQAVQSLLHTLWTPITNPFQKEQKGLIEHEYDNIGYLREAIYKKNVHINCPLNSHNIKQPLWIPREKNMLSYKDRERKKPKIILKSRNHWHQEIWIIQITYTFAIVWG